jgi:hypothetical protein
MCEESSPLTDRLAAVKFQVCRTPCSEETDLNISFSEISAGQQVVAFGWRMNRMRIIRIEENQGFRKTNHITA